MSISKKIIAFVIIISVSLFFSSNLIADGHGKMKGDVEVLHWWTSGGEAAALNVLKEDLEKKKIGWKDAAVAGGGGGNAMTVLKARVSSGNPPTALQMLGFDIIAVAELNLLANLNDVAEEENWDEVVPKALQRFSKYDGKWVAAPVNVHSVNWIWANKDILKKLKIKTPKTWNQLIRAAKKIKKAGYIPFAHGGQAWQDATVFDSIIYATGGKKFYMKAMIEQDPKALNSKTMVRAFDRLRVFGKLLDDNFSGRDWNQATAMVINGKAAFQVMGDWAKGEFLKAGKKPGKDFECFRFPGTQGAVLFNSDQFAMADVGSDRRKAQEEMAKSVMDPKFQSAFNVVKGSVPARVDVPDTDFDACGKKAMKQFASANKKGTLIGSMAHGHAGTPAVKNAYYDVVTAFLNNPKMSSKKAAKDLEKAIEAAKE